MGTAQRKIRDTSRRVLELMVQHGDGKGIVDWDSLDEKEPGWDDDLPSRTWARQTSHRLRYSGYFDKFKSAHTGNGNGSAGAAPGQSQLNPYHPDSNSGRLFGYILKFGDAKGYIDYKKLDAENPNWWKGYSDRAHAVIALHPLRNSAKGKAALLARKKIVGQSVLPGGEPQGDTPGTVDVPFASKDQMSAVIRMQVAKEVAKQVQQIMGKCRFCMVCGNDLALQYQAAHFGVKLSKKDMVNG